MPDAPQNLHVTAEILRERLDPDQVFGEIASSLNTLDVERNMEPGEAVRL